LTLRLVSGRAMACHGVFSAGICRNRLLDQAGDYATSEFQPLTATAPKFGEQTIRALRRSVGAFVPTVSHAECRYYFRHAGYVSTWLESAVVDKRDKRTLLPGSFPIFESGCGQIN
jgi:hypothetical protein